MKPSNIKERTYVTSFRGRLSSLATLALYFRDKGLPSESLASIVRIAVESMREIIISTHPKYEVVTSTQAIEVLENLGLYSVEGSNRAKNALVKELSLESLQLEGLTLPDMPNSNNQPFESQQFKQRILDDLNKRTCEQPEVVIPNLETTIADRQERDKEDKTNMADMVKNIQETLTGVSDEESGRIKDKSPELKDGDK